MAQHHTIVCALPVCMQEFPCSTGRLNQARAIDAPLYCSRTCAGIGRRTRHLKTEVERKAAKRLYDIDYRAKNAEARREQKHAYWEANKARIEAKLKVYRRAHRAEHTAYCQRPEYKAWKRDYDKQYLAKKHFGVFWESALLLQELETEIAHRATKTERASCKGTLNKAQQRRRAL